MSALDVFRQELRACLGPEISLKRDRLMRALFICDAPRRMSSPDILRQRLAEAGYEVICEDGLWRVEPDAARRQRFLADLSPGPLPRDPEWARLCRSLLRDGDMPPALQPWEPIRLTLLRLDAGEAEALLRELSADVALYKRARAPLPSGCAYIIEEYFCKEASPC